MDEIARFVSKKTQQLKHDWFIEMLLLPQLEEYSFIEGTGQNYSLVSNDANSVKSRGGECFFNTKRGVCVV